MSDREVEELKARLAALEGVKPRRAFPWKATLLVVAGLFCVFILIGVFGPKQTFGDMANREAADCVSSGDDGAWDPGMGNLQQVCQLKGDLKAIRAKSLEDAQQGSAP